MNYCDKTTNVYTKNYLKLTMSTLAMCLSLQATEAMERVDTNEFGLSEQELQQQVQMLERYNQRRVIPVQPIVPVPHQRMDEFDDGLESQRRLLAQFENGRRAAVPSIRVVPHPMPFIDGYGGDEVVARQLQAEEDARFHAHQQQINARDEALAREMQQKREAKEKERIRLGEEAALALQAQFLAEREERDVGADSAIVAQLYQRDLEEQEEARRRDRREAEDAASQELIARLEAERLLALAAAAQQHALPFAVPHPVALGNDGFEEYNEALFNPPEVAKPQLVLEADPHPPAREPVTGLLYNLACAELVKIGPMPIAQMRNQLVAHAFDYLGVLTQITPGQAQYIIDKMMGEDVGEEVDD